MNKPDTANHIDTDKRKFVKKAAYTAPAIMTMAAIPSFASAGSGFDQNHPPRRPGSEHRQPRPRRS